MIEISNSDRDTILRMEGVIRESMRNESDLKKYNTMRLMLRVIKKLKDK